jgi:hypothetical protein
MSAKQYQEPAFPVVCGGNVISPGMSLRDWFAGQAMAGMVSDGAILASSQIGAASCNQRIDDFIARVAYSYADSMLMERAKAPLIQPAGISDPVNLKPGP